MARITLYCPRCRKPTSHTIYEKIKDGKGYNCRICDKCGKQHEVECPRLTGEVHGFSS